MGIGVVYHYQVSAMNIIGESNMPNGISGVLVTSKDLDDEKDNQSPFFSFSSLLLMIAGFAIITRFMSPPGIMTR